MFNMNVLDMLSKIKLNPRELIRRLIKLIFLILILYLSLTTINKLDNSEITNILCINIIIYCIIEMLFPSIHLQK
jgi:hypothetical protein